MPSTLTKPAGFLVVIGASAGGLEAFTRLLAQKEEHDDIAYILIQHLSADHKSRLTSLLEHRTNLQVREAVDEDLLLPNQIFIVPAAKTVSIEGRSLIVSDSVRAKNQINSSINELLVSAAEAYEMHTIAVILSGAGSDGSKGVLAVAEAGGHVIVQDPLEAEFDGMPTSAIASGVANQVLPLEEILPAIIKHVNNWQPPQQIANPSQLKGIIELVHERTKCDFRNYKPETLIRRLERRIRSLGMRGVEDYTDFLRKNPREVERLCEEMLINVTQFFRDPEAYASLEHDVLRPLVKGIAPGTVIKIWCIACSTGEEPYSIALLLSRIIAEENRNCDFKIFATDLDQTNIEKASAGEFDISLKGLPPEYHKNFVRRGNRQVIIPALRKKIVFARHNVILDPPFIHNDLVTCRNMLIYMDSDLQQQVIARICFALKENAYLFLGSSESVATKNHLIQLNRKAKIFQRTGTPVRPLVTHQLRTQQQEKKETITAQFPVNNTFRDIDDFIHKNSGIAMFLTDKSFNIVRAEGNFTRYTGDLQFGFEHSLLHLLHPALSQPLNEALLRASSTLSTQSLNGLLCETERGSYVAELWIIPDEETGERYTILINSITIDPDDQEIRQTIGNSYGIKGKETPGYQILLEQFESVNEELQSNNEELLSANEELQSTNEELQSLNEELHTLNTEHQQRIRELVELNDDMNNYFTGSDIGQIILDRQLRIRKYNPAASELISLRESDLGRKVSDLTTRFELDTFSSDIQQAMSKRITIERDLRLDQGKTYLLRINPYLTSKGDCEGIVLTFFNITEFQRLNDEMDGVFRASPAGILIVNATVQNGNTRLSVKDFNTTAENIFGDVLKRGQLTLEDIDPQINSHVRSFINITEAGAKEDIFDVKLINRWLHIITVKIPEGATLTVTDVTDERLSLQRLRQSYTEAFTAKEKLRELNRTLEDTIRERTRELSISEERFRLVSQVTSDAIVDWSFFDNNIWLSDNFYRLFGFQPEQIRSRNDWNQRIDPADRPRVLEFINNALHGKDDTWEIEYNYLDAAGKRKTVTDRAYILRDESGTPYRLLSSMLDITSLRQAEQELERTEVNFRLALDVSELAGWDVDIETNEVHYSKNLPAIFGHSPDSQMSREQLQQQIVPEDRELVAQENRKAMETSEYKYEARIMWPDSSIHWIKTHGRVLYDNSGKPVKMTGIVRDITAEKETSLALESKVKERTAALQDANRQLSRSNRELEKSNADLQQFAYIASHDLQEPLRKIRMFASLLEADKKGVVDIRKLSGRISAAAQRMSELIQDVLDFTKVVSLEDAFQEVSLSKVMEDVLEDFELQIKEKKALVKVEALPDVDAIPHQMNQLFYNLFSNALKFNEGPPQITISATIEEAVNVEALRNGEFQKYHCIRITDNGIGFDKKYAGTVFSVFSRVTSDPKFKGTGIGLAICKKIIEIHRGTITVDSKKNIGSTFNVYLPVKKLK